MSSDDAIKKAGGVSAKEDLPHVTLEQSLCKTKEIVAQVQLLSKAQEEADRKANKEVRSHEKTKEMIKKVEAEQGQVRDLMEKELREHSVSKDRLEKAEREHNKTRDSLQAQRHEVSSMLLQMEALKVEMEAQRKAFVVNVNWAARCTDLKVKFDQSKADYDKLWDQNIATKGALETAKKVSQEYRTKAVAICDDLDIAKAQLDKQTLELSGKPTVTEEIAKDLEEWQRYKQAQAAEAIAQKQGRSKAMGVLQRQLAQGDQGLLTSNFSGWSVYVRDEVKRRKHKDQAMKQAMKNIGSEGLALLSQCFGPWRKDTEREKLASVAASNRKLEEANQKSGGSAAMARKKALAQLEKQFLGQDKALTKQFFNEWASGKALRKKKENNMQKGARMIANSGNALVAEVFMTWNVETEKTRKEKAMKASGHQKAARMIANSGKALVANIFDTVARWVRGIASERKKKAAGNEKAVRMMANSGKMLMNICFDSWAKVQGEKKKKEAGGKKAARMISGNNQALIVAVMEGWRSQFVTLKAKEKNTAKAVRMIAASSEALQASCFVGWRDDIRKNREKNKKLRAVEKTLGATADGIKMIVTTAWIQTHVADLRKKRGKGRSMTSAMKSINSNKDLLMTQVCMGWARMIAQGRVEKLQEKVKEAEQALADAMTTAKEGVEKDLAACQEQVDKCNEEVEKVRKELDEAKLKVETLENQIEEGEALIVERKCQLEASAAELKESQKKAHDISEELAKVGIFLQNATPRRQSRPRSGAKASDNVTPLPKLGKDPSRPQSGGKAR